MLRKTVFRTLLLSSLVPAAVAAPGWAAGLDDARGGPSASAGAATAAQPEPEFVEGEVLVRFDTSRLGVKAAATETRAVEAAGGRVAEHYDAVAPGLQRVELDDGVSVQAAVAQLNARDDVLYAEPNYLVYADGVPNDSRFGDEWAMHNTGQTVNGIAGTPDADIDAPEAWNVTTGSSDVVVAVIDSGVAYDHPDLAPNMWVNTDEIAGNGIDDDRNGKVDDRRGWDWVDDDNDPTDEQGHGTHVAGTIGARGNNDTAGGGTTDVAGVAWNVKLMPLRVLDEEGVGSNADLISAVNYANFNGAQIANMSLGGRWPNQVMFDAMAAAPGVTFVVAAGNDGADLEFADQYPCEYDLPNIVCVANTDQNDELARFSNYGALSVDIAAPGTNILSTSRFSRAYFEDFESPLSGRWVTGGTPNTWARTTAVPQGTGNWLTDSPGGNYVNNADNWARTNAINLSGRRDCIVEFRAWIDILDSNFDFLRVETATNNAGPWTQILELSVPHPDAGAIVGHMPDDTDNSSNVFLRFRFDADEEFTGDGVYLDDVAVKCSGKYGADSYETLSGTSMATPHVSGVAALIKARNPGFTTAQVKAKLLNSVDTKASLRDVIGTGGRINAFKAVSGTAPNQLPTADAGADITTNPGKNVPLSGRGSDPEGTPLTYLWTQLTGTPVTIRDATSANASFTAPSTTGTMSFRLRVTDAGGASGVDDVMVHVVSPK
jgi:subtilisin family serine protease